MTRPEPPAQPTGPSPGAYIGRPITPPVPAQTAPEPEPAAAEQAAQPTSAQPTPAAAVAAGTVVAAGAVVAAPQPTPAPTTSTSATSTSGAVTSGAVTSGAVTSGAVTSGAMTVASAAAAPAEAQAVPTQLARARAIPDAGRQDPPGTHDERPPDGHRLAALSGRLARLRIGSHTVSRSALSQLRVPSYGTGLVLGADQHQRPVPVHLFRSRPTQVALVGGTWASQLLAFRALALGAQIAVSTIDPGAWQGFGERATGHGDRVMMAQRPLTASAQQPLLVIYDVGGAQMPPLAPLGPWQTQMTVLRQLEPSSAPVVQTADLVMLQRLGTEEARVAGRSLRLGPQSTQYLQVMADDMVALVADGADYYIWFTQTAVEREHTGAPRR